MNTAMVWFRQDLRLSDNPAFFEACSRHGRVVPLYIVDARNSPPGSAQSWWLHHSLNALEKSLLDKLGLKLTLRKGNPLEIILELAKEIEITAVYWNRCYEPLAVERDKCIKKVLKQSGIEVKSFNGSLFHEPWTIKNKNNDFFKVFTPFWRACRKTLSPQPTKEVLHAPAGIDVSGNQLEEWKLLPSVNWASQFPNFWTPGEEGAQKRLADFIDNHLCGYKTNRDFPAKAVTSRLSPHLHFGEISPWTILRAIELSKLNQACDWSDAEHFLSELGWREFSYSLLYHFPHLPSKNFRSEFDTFPWSNDESSLERWRKGLTGYPIVDAGMRELWATGYMHNRVRMITASFLTKDLFIDWRLGAEWFLDTLVDADLANNSANWQWVAGCGVDAVPYFRIFNPVLQSEKFDPRGDYIRRWIPELSSLDGHTIHKPWESAHSREIYTKTNYPKPMINHSECRAKALQYYGHLKKGGPI